MKPFSRRMRKITSTTLLVIFVFFAEQLTAAVKINFHFNSRIILNPGVDLVRQSITTVTLDATQPYAVQLSDENAGNLVHEHHRIPYQVSYNDGVDRVLSASPQTVESGTSVTNVSRNIAVTIRGHDTATAVAGEYNATLVVTITAF